MFIKCYDITLTIKKNPSLIEEKYEKCVTHDKAMYWFFCSGSMVNTRLRKLYKYIRFFKYIKNLIKWWKFIKMVIFLSKTVT